MGIITYNGISSKDLGLIVQTIPSYDFPEKDLEYVHVNGRNGDIIQNNKSYKNITRTYYIAKVYKKGESFINSANAIVEWLHSSDTYVRLEDSYEPDFYRMAIFKNEGNLQDYYSQATTLEISFDCKPQKWLKSGDISYEIGNGITLINPTNYDSKPIIEVNVTANTTVNIIVGNCNIEIKDIPSNDIVTIDCENMECYSQTNNYNKYVSINTNEFPELKKHSETSISVTANTIATIKPRWWTI